MFKNNIEKQKKFMKFIRSINLIIFLMNIFVMPIFLLTSNFNVPNIKKILITSLGINVILSITFYISILVYKEAYNELKKDNYIIPHKHTNKKNIKKQKKLIKFFCNLSLIMIFINIIVIPIIADFYNLDLLKIYKVTGIINGLFIFTYFILMFIYKDAYNEIEKDNYIIPHNYTNKNETLNLFKELIIKKKYKYKYEKNIENNQLTFFDNNHTDPQDIIILVDLQNTDENALKMLYEHILYLKVKIGTRHLVVNIIFLSNKYNKELVRKIEKALFSVVINILFISFDKNYKYIETQSHSFTTIYFFNKIFKLLEINKKERIKLKNDLYDI